MQRIKLVPAGAAGYLTLAIVVFALRRPEYSHLRSTISELGEFGAPDSHLVSLGVFFPVGLAMATFSIFIWKAPREKPGGRSAAALAMCVAVGYLVAAFFPCDPGSPLSGTARQAIHNWGGAIEYFGGAIALFSLARAQKQFRWVFAAAGLITLTVAFVISAPDLAEVRGLLQRIAEASLFGSVFLATGLNTPAKPREG